MDKFELTNLSFNTGEFVFGFTNEIRSIIIDYLKILFKYSDLGTLFRYDEEERRTKVHIFSVYPVEVRKFPRILVSVNLNAETKMGFGDVGIENREEISLVGKLEYNCKVDIEDVEDINVMKLSDICLLFLANRFYRVQLQKVGVIIDDSKGFRISDIVERRLSPQVLYWGNTISFNLWAEYQQIFAKKGIVVKGEILEMEI